MNRLRNTSLLAARFNQHLCQRYIINRNCGFLNEAIRGFSTSGLYREEEKKEEKKVEKKNSIWGNIVDFVKTIQEGRRLKKVEEEMKQQYTKLVANALLETIRDQKQMKRDVEKQFNTLSDQMTQNFKDLKKDMDMKKISSEMEKKFGQDMNKTVRSIMEEKLKEEGGQDFKKMEKEMASMLGNKDDMPEPEPINLNEWDKKASKFRQMVEKQKQEKNKK